MELQRLSISIVHMYVYTHTLTHTHTESASCFVWHKLSYMKTSSRQALITHEHPHTNKILQDFCRGPRKNEQTVLHCIIEFYKRILLYIQVYRMRCTCRGYPWLNAVHLRPTTILLSSPTSLTFQMPTPVHRNPKHSCYDLAIGNSLEHRLKCLVCRSPVSSLLIYSISLLV